MWCFNVESSEYDFYMNTKILQDFQICISVPFFKCLNILEKKNWWKRGKKKKQENLPDPEPVEKKLTVDRT